MTFSICPGTKFAEAAVRNCNLHEECQGGQGQMWWIERESGELHTIAAPRLVNLK